MAKTWDNVPCWFNTQNTSNDRGDSEYRVWTNRMLRNAPVNAERNRDALNQVYNFMSKSICYLDEHSQLYDLIMHTADERIKIDSVIHDTIYVNADGTVLPAHRRPADGLITFDVVNNNGDLSHIHVGHAVKNLKLF